MAARLQDRIYSRTAAGEEAFASDDVAIPSDYRRILRVIEGKTHADVIRGRLRHYADALLADWLAELEELGFVSSVPADATQDLDFSGLLKAQQLRGERTTPDDSQRMDAQATDTAVATLGRTGAFLSPDRLQHRAPLAKKPTEIRVLIVEDDPDQAALADLRVSMAGYEVRLARNCRELVQEIRTRKIPDVVLLDIMLPDGNGFDVLVSMRRHPKLALLPVIMLTALGHPEQVRRGLALGADGYITKPYSKKILTDTIGAVLKHA
jgi:CheY-like chemotaxis protein